MSGTSRNGSRSANGENAPNTEVVGKAKRRRFSSANKLRIEPVPVSRTHSECRRMSGDPKPISGPAATVENQLTLSARAARAYDPGV